MVLELVCIIVDLISSLKEGISYCSDAGYSEKAHGIFTQKFILHFSMAINLTTKSNTEVTIWLSFENVWQDRGGWVTCLGHLPLSNSGEIRPSNFAKMWGT